MKILWKRGDIGLRAIPLLFHNTWLHVVFNVKTGIRVFRYAVIRDKRSRDNESSL